MPQTLWSGGHHQQLQNPWVFLLANSWWYWYAQWNNAPTQESGWQDTQDMYGSWQVSVTIYTNAVQWSSQIQVRRDCIDYWLCILRMKLVVITSKNTIKKLSIKIGEQSGYYVTSLAALEKLKIAWKEYRAAKKESISLRKIFSEEEVAQKAHVCNVLSENMMKMKTRKELSIQEGIDFKKSRVGIIYSQH